MTKAKRTYFSTKTARARRSSGLAAVCVVAATFGVGVTSDVTGAAPVSGSLTSDMVEVFVGVEPVRVLDTRSGVGAPSPGPFGPAEIRTLVVAGTETIPANATSVAINTTLPGAASSGSYITIWPTGAPQPSTSVNNATPGQAVPNFTVSRVGTGGGIDVFNQTGNIHIVIDVVGFYVPLSTVDAADAPGGAMYSGVGRPSNAVGRNGDFYLEQAEIVMYQKAENTWGDPAVTLGEPGAGVDVLVGSGVPGSPIGVDGDLYLDPTTNTLYGPKTGSSWGAGVPIAGAGLLVGVGPPLGTLGSNRDLYLDRAKLELYGPKAAGAWGPAMALNPGPHVLLGTRPPNKVGFGAIGDIYVDTSRMVVYGPKNASGWGGGIDLNGPPTAESDSALSAKADNASLDLMPATTQTILKFPDAGVGIGTAITQVDDGTFRFNDHGVYKVTFVAERSASPSLFGNIEVRVDGAVVDDSASLAAAGQQVTGTMLVDALEGDALELWATGLGVSPGDLPVDFDGSIVIELIAVT